MSCHLSLSLTTPSIKRSLEQSLSSVFDIQSFPLYRIRATTGITYQSPIAIQLAEGNREKALEINQQVISSLLPSRDRVDLKFKVTIAQSSLLEFTLADRQIARWLKKLPELFLTHYPLSPINYPPLEIDDEFFSLQYTHARCCSLLRSGHLDNLIQLETLDFHQLPWFWSSPEPLPVGRRWQQPEERELIAQIISVIDSLDSVRSIPALKLASNLSEAFLKFERSCRIWGEVKCQNPTLAQARLGLTAIVQLLLRFLLKDELGVIPWIEL